MRFSSNSKIQESSFKRDVVSLKSQCFPRITVPVEPVTAFIKLAYLFQYRLAACATARELSRSPRVAKSIFRGHATRHVVH